MRISILSIVIMSTCKLVNEGLFMDGVLYLLAATTPTHARNIENLIFTAIWIPEHKRV
jgi:hypothetical protein